jgi:hypothetical protein
LVLSFRSSEPTPTCSRAVSWFSVRPWNESRKGELLEQPEDFEDDHNNDNYSNYVKDVSAHAADSYQIANAMVNIWRNLPAITRRLIYSEDSPNESTELKRPSDAEKIQFARQQI